MVRARTGVAPTAAIPSLLRQAGGMARDRPVHYTSPEEDSARWQGFPFREGDVVVSSRSKSGTTWLQAVCLVLVLQTPDLPSPLGDLSPWLDWTVRPRDDVVARLAAQPHRRVIKTHTPLDGLPLDERATFVVPGRHPLDMAVSLYHQGANIDRARLARLTGIPAETGARVARPPLRDWLLGWIDWEGDPLAPGNLDTLPGVLRHMGDAWERRRAPNVVLVHYDELAYDLDAAMRRLSGRLGIAVDPTRWPDLVQATAFARMRRDADRFVPDTTGVLRDAAAFFRHGVSGDGVRALGEAGTARYEERVAALAPADLLEWLHGGPPGTRA